MVARGFDDARLGCSRRTDVDVPEAVSVVAAAGEHWEFVSEDGDGGGVEGNIEAVVAELSDGDQGTLEVGEKMCDAGFTGNICAGEQTAVRCLKIGTVRLRNF